MVMDSLTPLAFGAILRTKGITFTSRVADGATNFRFQAREAGPHWITVILSPNGDILQTVAFLFRRSSDVSMARVNSWNKDKRFGRAYIDKDGDGVLESDLVLKGGVTVEAVNDWLDLYFRLLTAFAQHVGYRGS
jgi:hypothetical protein